MTPSDWESLGVIGTLIQQRLERAERAVAYLAALPYCGTPQGRDALMELREEVARGVATRAETTNNVERS